MPKGKTLLPFRFKHFSVHHNNSAFKVGTDGVLLGAWANIKQAKSILDIGTGSGLIALICAQRNENATIKGIEIDEGSFTDATKNTEASTWKNRLNIELTDANNFLEINKQKFDYIISNPPFFNAGTHSENNQKNNARHTKTLSHSTIIKIIISFLTETGKAGFVLPPQEAEQFIETAKTQNLHLVRTLNIKARPDRKIERILFELQRFKETPKTEELIIRALTSNIFTKQYQKITQNFYLNF